MLLELGCGLQNFVEPHLDIVAVPVSKAVLEQLLVNLLVLLAVCVRPFKNDIVECVSSDVGPGILG